MDSELSSEVGIAGQLFKSCVDFFWLVLQCVVALDGVSDKNKVTLRNEFERFYFWGHGYRSEHGGLDDILQHSKDLRDETLLVLTEIGKCICSKDAELLRKLSILQDARFVDQRHDLLSWIEKTTCYVHNEDESETSSELSDETAPEDSLESTLDDLHTYIGCLYSLALSLEHPVPDHAEREMEAPAVRPLTVPGPAVPWCRRVIDKFEQLDPRIAERLGEANWHRFERISKQLEEASDGELTDSEEATDDKTLGTPPENTASGISTTTKSTFVSDSVFSTKLSDQTSQPTTAPTLLSDPEYNFHLDAKVGFDDSASQGTWTSGISQSDDLSRLRVPPLPEAVITKAAFRCTVCGDRVKDVKNRLDWKRHVFSDLEPYICLFPDCKDGLKTYSTRQAWVDHEFKTHRSTIDWNCPACPSHFTDAERLRAHINILHSKFTAIERNLGMKAAESRSFSRNENQCPFCHRELGNNVRQFGMHVGRHLDEIALAVLPRDQQAEDQSDSESSVPSANDSVAEPPSNPPPYKTLKQDSLHEKETLSEDAAGDMIIRVSDSATALATHLTELGEMTQGVGFNFIEMVNQLSDLRAALQTLQELDMSIKGSTLFRDQLQESLAGSLTSCETLFAAIEEQLLILRLRPEFRFRWNSMKTSRFFKKLEDLSPLLDSQIRALQLLLTVCQARTLTEQRQQLRTDMEPVMSDNADVLEQLRQLIKDTQSVTSDNVDVSDTESVASNAGSVASVSLDVDPILMNSRAYKRAHTHRHRSASLSRSDASEGDSPKSQNYRDMNWPG